jgi:hypothetical protein
MKTAFIYPTWRPTGQLLFFQAAHLEVVVAPGLTI